ncbi:MAG: FliM/FliN family flagellar motor switch protein [Gemmatales bacterium]|nr:FliM/FliN family flagellar motor switch protein [Gemmatales bacterium]
MTAAAKPYDFRQPQPEAPEVRRQVEAWLTALAQHWSDWAQRQLGMTWRCQLGTIRRCFIAHAFEDMPPSLLVYPLAWSAQAGSLLGVSRPLALALTLALLGEKTDTLPADRPLTPIETSLWEYLLDQHLLARMKTSWVGPAMPSWQRGALETTPQFSGILKQQTCVLRAELHSPEPFAEARIIWLLTEAVLQEYFRPARPDASASVAPQMLAQAIPLQVTVQLGQTQLPLTQLQRLRCGDVLLLEQRLDEPLMVFLEHEPHFRAWPGRLGRQRAIQIAAFWEP